MSQKLQELFALFQDEINDEIVIKNKLNDLEQEFNNQISLIRSDYYNLSSIQPIKLSEDENMYLSSSHLKSFTFNEELNQINPEIIHENKSRINNIKLLSNTYHKFTERLNRIDCKPIFKDRLYHKIHEEIIYLMLMNRYFKVISYHFKKHTNDVNGKISIPLVSKGNDVSLGLIITPDEILQLLSLEKLNYSDYLLSLLKFIESIVDYTTETIILISIDSDASNYEIKRQYSLSLVNLQTTTRLQSGFQMLDLKNDNIRRKYDGLKYNLKKINSIVYDLSLRNLILNEVEIY